jgi:hypothetical protein
MNKEEVVLDALAWAGISETARIARIANKLTRGTNRYCTTVTKTAIAEAVRVTIPPYGRGKAICEGVAKEIERQHPIYAKRHDAQEAWERYLAHMAEMSVRINNAYASRFGRPTFSPATSYQGHPNEQPYGGGSYWEASQAHQEAESKRDKGDSCVAFLIYQEVYAVALLRSANNLPGSNYVAVRNRLSGEAVYTALRVSCEHFVDAVLSLGGPKVRSALAQGLQVCTDWVGRRSVITHREGKTETLPWLSERHTQTSQWHTDTEPTVLLGEEETLVVEVQPD